MFPDFPWIYFEHKTNIIPKFQPYTPPQIPFVIWGKSWRLFLQFGEEIAGGLDWIGHFFNPQIAITRGLDWIGRFFNHGSQVREIPSPSHLASPLHRLHHPLFLPHRPIRAWFRHHQNAHRLETFRRCLRRVASVPSHVSRELLPTRPGLRRGRRDVLVWVPRCAMCRGQSRQVRVLRGGEWRFCPSGSAVGSHCLAHRPRLFGLVRPFLSRN